MVELAKKRFKWTDARKERAKQMKADGCTYKEIAKKLGAPSAKSVCEMFFRVNNDVNFGNFELF